MRRSYLREASPACCDNSRTRSHFFHGSLFSFSFLRLSVPLRTAIAARYVFLARSAGLQTADVIGPVIGRSSLTAAHWICVAKTDLGSGPDKDCNSLPTDIAEGANEFISVQR